MRGCWVRGSALGARDGLALRVLWALGAVCLLGWDGVWSLRGSEDPLGKPCGSYFIWPQGAFWSPRALGLPLPSRALSIRREGRQTTASWGRLLLVVEETRIHLVLPHPLWPGEPPGVPGLILYNPKVEAWPRHLLQVRAWDTCYPTQNLFWRPGSWWGNHSCLNPTST